MTSITLIIIDELGASFSKEEIKKQFLLIQELNAAMLASVVGAGIVHDLDPIQRLTEKLEPPIYYDNAKRKAQWKNEVPRHLRRK